MKHLDDLNLVYTSSIAKNNHHRRRHPHGSLLAPKHIRISADKLAAPNINYQPARIYGRYVFQFNCRGGTGPRVNKALYALMTEVISPMLILMRYAPALPGYPAIHKVALRHAYLRCRGDSVGGWVGGNGARNSI